MMKKIIAIRGIHGFVGSKLSEELEEKYEVMEISRGDVEGPEKLDKIINRVDVVVNLAGAPIVQRWTESARKRILDSRVKTTEKLVYSINRMKESKHLVNASAIGVYDDQGVHNEQSRNFADNFLSEVVRAWEQPVQQLSDKHKHSIMRFSLVMGIEGGAFPRLLKLFKMGLGGKISSGKQYMSLIHINDLVRATQYIIEKELEGIFNTTAPSYTTNKEFTKLLARDVRRPALFTVPGFALRILYGKAALTLMEGQAVIPGRLNQEKFSFRYQNVEEIIKDLT